MFYRANVSCISRTLVDGCRRGLLLDHEHKARCLQPRGRARASFLNLFKGFDRCHAGHLVRLLVAHFGKRVDVASALARAQYLKLAQIQRADWRTTERLVERMLGQTGACCGIAAMETTPDHGLDSLAHLAGDAG